MRQIKDQIQHAEHHVLLDYWLSKKRGDTLPARSDIDPVDFPRLLPRIALIEVLREESGLHFRYRLAGTEIVERAGRDPTGKRFDELYSGEYLDAALRTYHSIVESGQPHLSERTFPLVHGLEYLRYDRLVLPLASDGRTVDMLLLLIAVIEQSRTRSPG